MHCYLSEKHTFSGTKGLFNVSQRSVLYVFTCKNEHLLILLADLFFLSRNENFLEIKKIRM